MSSALIQSIAAYDGTKHVINIYEGAWALFK